MSPIQDPDAFAKKESIVDIFCTDTDGCQYIIEMQVAKTEGFEERAQYYASKAFISQMNKEGAYAALKEVIFLAFTSFGIFPEKKHYKSEHVVLNRKTYERDLDKLSFTFIDLPKFDQQREKDITKLTLEEKFYYFLQHGGDIEPEELEKLIGEDKIIKEAYKELEVFYLTENERLLYEKEEKRRRDRKATLVFAKEEGLKEGEEKGLKKGLKKGKKEKTKEIAEQMLKEGIDMKLIQKITGLTPPLLEQMKKNIKGP